MKYESTKWNHGLDTVVEEKEQYPCVYLDVPKGMSLKGLEVGDMVEMTLKGRMKGLSDREYGKSIDVELRDLTMSGGPNEFEEMAEDD